MICRKSGGRAQEMSAGVQRSFTFPCSPWQDQSPVAQECVKIRDQGLTSRVFGAA